MATTLADVARQADVSPGLVSRVLNNKMNMPIPQPTIERVRRAAQELGYRPNALARALATGKTRTLGLFYRGLTEVMFLRILDAVEARARERQYRLVVTSDMESFAADGSIDGLICIASLDDFPQHLLPRTKPVVFVSPSRENDARPNLLTWSEYDAAALAVEYLVKLGHRHLGALWGEYRNDEAAFPRMAGFRAAVRQANITAIEETGERHPNHLRKGYLQMQRVLEQPDRPTAIFARNDYLAVGALKALGEAGISVPRDMSLIHYGNSILSEAACPSLTSVSHPNAEASVLALEQLIELIEKRREEFQPINLPIALCERDSCAPPIARS